MPVSKSLEAFFAEWLRAAQEGDVSWFSANLADDFMYIHQMGGLSSKADLIGANSRHQNRYELRELETRSYGEVRVAVGRYFAQGVIPASVPVTAHLRERYAAGCELRFTLICRDSPERTSCVGLHTTVIENVS
ncbi:MAG TPA: nuclear transport factor 2 family protein [Candidatus Saccharimonadales bacterium]|nr:nuclear transport factor 2 family protein [Candidatus Saccharimonadales bacterium]